MSLLRLVALAGLGGLTGCGYYPEQPSVSSYGREAEAEVMRPAAERGDAGAQVNLGYFYERGQGVPRDEARAAELYRRAAAQGNVHGLNNLAVMLATGRGVARDDKQAMRLFAEAARRGYAPARSRLAVLCLRPSAKGAGVDAEAFAALRDDVAKGFAGQYCPSQTLAVGLASALEKGEGTPADPDAAIALLERFLAHDPPRGRDSCHSTDNVKFQLGLLRRKWRELPR